MKKIITIALLAISLQSFSQTTFQQEKLHDEQKQLLFNAGTNLRVSNYMNYGGLALFGLGAAYSAYTHGRKGNELMFLGALCVVSSRIYIGKAGKKLQQFSEKF